MSNTPASPPPTRRQFLGLTVRGASLVALGGVLGTLLAHRHANGDTVWQIDPAKCTQCGKCATACVLNPSAVKCFHAYALCGYCDLCTGYFEAQPNALTTAAENQLCPTGAIQRKFVEDPYFQYTIDTDLCLGCAKCVKGCTTYGNGSLYLQIDHGGRTDHAAGDKTNHTLCKNCNRCAIAAVCPSDAFRRVPAPQPYLANKIRTA